MFVFALQIFTFLIRSWNCKVPKTENYTHACIDTHVYNLNDGLARVHAHWGGVVRVGGAMGRNEVRFPTPRQNTDSFDLDHFGES